MGSNSGTKRGRGRRLTVDIVAGEVVLVAGEGLCFFGEGRLLVED